MFASTITYPGVGASTATRCCHVADSGDTRYVVITENEADEGTSITNAAEQLLSVAEATFGLVGKQLVVVEHYVDSMSTGHTFDQVVLADGGVEWRPIPWALMLAALGVDQFPPAPPQLGGAGSG